MKQRCRQNAKRQADLQEENPICVAMARTEKHKEIFEIFFLNTEEL